MFCIEEKTKVDYVKEMLEQMEDVYTNLRLEYLEMAGLYDDALETIRKRETDIIYLEELLEESRKEGSLG